MLYCSHCSFNSITSDVNVLLSNVGKKEFNIAERSVQLNSNCAPTIHFDPSLKKAKMETQNLFNANNKDFQCPICQKYFCRKFTLDMHLLIHKGIKPHPCPFCGKCFRQRGTLMRHKALHSANNLFFCNLCNRGFRQKNVFLHHLKHRHNVSTETLDRRKYRTQLKDYESIMDTLPSFVLANSTAISTSEKDLDAMLLEAMNGITCESSKTGCQTTTHGLDNNSSDNDSYPTGLQNSNFLKSDESVQELRYECELCCLQFLDFTSYRLHIEEEHNNDVNLLDQKPFLFSVMSETESVYLNEAPVPAEKENMPSHENLSCVYKDHTKNALSSVEKSNKDENSRLECTLCHEFLMSEEDFGRHMESHMQKILNENVNMQEKFSNSDQATASSNLKSDVVSEIDSNAMSLTDEVKLVQSKDLGSESTLNRSVSLPATSDSVLVSNKDSNSTNELIKNSNKHFKCSICKCYCSSDICLNQHMEKHRLQKMLRMKNHHLKINNWRAASLNAKYKLEHQSKIYFSSGTKRDTSLNNTKVYSCTICTKKFKDKESFEYHKQMHLSARSFCCGQCKQRFSNKQSLLIHTRSTHLKTFKCSSCSRTFNYRKLYNFHRKKCLNSKVHELKANMDFPMVEINELMKSNVEGLIGVIPLCDKRNSDKNLKIGIPIFTLQHAKNIAQLPLLGFS